MKKADNVTWIPERLAAKMLDYTPEWFRRIVKGEKLPIAFRSSGGRKYQYSKEDIEKYQLLTSTH